MAQQEKNKKYYENLEAKNKSENSFPFLTISVDLNGNLSVYATVTTEEAIETITQMLNVMKQGKKIEIPGQFKIIKKK